VSHRTFTGAIALALLSCVRTHPPSDMGDAKSNPAPTAPPMVRAASPTTPEATALRIEDEPRHLEVKPLDATKQREASAVRSSDGKYALETELGSFVVWAGSTRRVVSKGSGWFARWVSDTEVAFLDAAGQLTKVDVTDPSRTTRGGQVCANELRCDLDERPPRLEWASGDLERAVVRGRYDEPFVVRKGEVARLATALDDKLGLKIVALCVSKGGHMCVLMGHDPEQPRKPGVKVEANIVRLRCAESAWTGWRHVRDFSVDGPLDMIDLDAQVKFFSEREVLISLPSRNEPSNRIKYSHCIVALETAAARCTPNAHPAWYPLGDGRWVVEHTLISAAPPHLIDVVHGRSWAIGDDSQAVWWKPQPHARVPGTIVLKRLDMADVRAGTLILPLDP
jgi:hypothetical protein